MPSIRDTSIMLKLIMVLLYMMTEWLDWMKPMPAYMQTQPSEQRSPSGVSALPSAGQGTRVCWSCHTATQAPEKACWAQQRTAHVSGEVEDVLAALDNLLAVVVDPEVHQMELIAERLLLQNSTRRP